MFTFPLSPVAEEPRQRGAEHDTDEEDGGRRLVHPFLAADEIPLGRNHSAHSGLFKKKTNTDTKRYI